MTARFTTKGAFFGVVCLTFCCWLSACEYDPPPEIAGSIPAPGSIASDVDTTVAVEFSEPVKENSIEVHLARRVIDSDGLLLPFCKAQQAGRNCSRIVAGPCVLGKECEGADLSISGDRTEFIIVPWEPFEIGEYVLRFSEGIEDDAGNETGVPYDVFFFVSPLGSAGPTTFQPGVFLTWLDLDQPFYFPIEVYWHIRVESDTGRIYGGGCDGDQIDPDEARIFDHTKWKPVPYLEEEGFKLVFDGQVQDATVEDEEGDDVDGYILATNPFYIYCAQPQVEVMDGRVTFSVYFDEETGRQVARGTLLSTETYIFDTPAHSHPQEASGVLFGYRLREDEVGSGKIWEDCADLETITRP